MAISRYYKIEAVVRVPIEHEFPESVRQDCFMRLKGETTASDMVLEQVRHILREAGMPAESIHAGLIDWVIT